MIVWIGRRALTREDPEGVGLLVRHEHVAPARRRRVNRDALMVLGKARGAEEGEFVPCILGRRIREVLANARRFVAVADEPEFLVYRHGLDLLLPAPRANGPG